MPMSRVRCQKTTSSATSSTVSEQELQSLDIKALTQQHAAPHKELADLFTSLTRASSTEQSTRQISQNVLRQLNKKGSASRLEKPQAASFTSAASAHTKVSATLMDTGFDKQCTTQSMPKVSGILRDVSATHKCVPLLGKTSATNQARATQLPPSSTPKEVISTSFTRVILNDQFSYDTDNTSGKVLSIGMPREFLDDYILFTEKLKRIPMSDNPHLSRLSQRMQREIKSSLKAFLCDAIKSRTVERVYSGCSEFSTPETSEKRAADEARLEKVAYTAQRAVGELKERDFNHTSPTRSAESALEELHEMTATSGAPKAPVIIKSNELAQKGVDDLTLHELKAKFIELSRTDDQHATIMIDQVNKANINNAEQLKKVEKQIKVSREKEQNYRSRQNAYSSTREQTELSRKIIREADQCNRACYRAKQLKDKMSQQTSDIKKLKGYRASLSNFRHILDTAKLDCTETPHIFLNENSFDTDISIPPIPPMVTKTTEHAPPQTTQQHQSEGEAERGVKLLEAQLKRLGQSKAKANSTATTDVPPLMLGGVQLKMRNPLQNMVEQTQQPIKRYISTLRSEESHTVSTQMLIERANTPYRQFSMCCKVSRSIPSIDLSMVDNLETFLPTPPTDEPLGESQMHGFAPNHSILELVPAIFPHLPRPIEAHHSQNTIPARAGALSDGDMIHEEFKTHNLTITSTFTVEDIPLSTLLP